MKRLKGSGPDIKYSGIPARGFSEASPAVGTSAKVILACGCADSNHADMKRFTHLADGDFSIRYAAAGKGYGCEYVHREIQERPGEDAVIPLKKMPQPCRTSSTG